MRIEHAALFVEGERALPGSLEAGGDVVCVAYDERGKVDEGSAVGVASGDVTGPEDRRGEGFPDGRLLG